MSYVGTVESIAARLPGVTHRSSVLSIIYTGNDGLYRILLLFTMLRRTEFLALLSASNASVKAPPGF